MSRLQRAILSALLIMVGSAAYAGNFSIGVVPQFPAAELHRAWRPVADHLETVTGHRFDLHIPTSIPSMEAAFLSGQFDFIYVNPYHAVMARRAQQYVPLVRAGDSPLVGILVVRADSPVRDLQGLAGQTIAFPAPNAFGASLYMRALLAERHKIEIRPEYVKTHSNAYRHVMLGHAAAAGGLRKTLSHEPPELQRGLRVIFETPPTPPHPVAAHPRVPEEARKAVTEALMRLADSPRGRAMLAEIQLEAPVYADYVRDFRPLEALNLEKHAVHPRQ